MTFIIYSDDYLLHDNPNHPENANRLKEIIDFLKKTPFYEKLEFIKPEKDNEEEIAKVHSIDMIEEAKNIGGLTWTHTQMNIHMKLPS